MIVHCTERCNRRRTGRETVISEPDKTERAEQLSLARLANGRLRRAAPRVMRLKPSAEIEPGLPNRAVQPVCESGIVIAVLGVTIGKSHRPIGKLSVPTH